MSEERYIGRLISRFVLGSALASALLMAVGSPAVRADDRSGCSSRLEKAQSKLNADVARHGDKSHQADSDRAKLEQARQWCRDHKVDYDHDKYDDHH